MNGKNDLTEGPVREHIKRIAVPVSIGFFFHTMYNVVDTFYGGLVSTEALAGLSLSFPVFFLILAMGIGIATGATALIAHALGEKNERQAGRYASQALGYSVLAGVALTVVGLAVAPALFRILGAEGAYLAVTLEYINVIFLGTVLFLANFSLDAVLSAQGETKPFRNFLVVGFLLNLVLDPWFLFGGFGLPAMGLAGIAWATVVIQGLGVAYMAYKASASGLLCFDRPHRFVPKLDAYKELTYQGVPASVNMLTVAAGIFVITFFVSGYGKEAVAAFGLGQRIDQIAMLPTIGLTRAAIALVGQNRGARKMARVKETVTVSWKWSLYIMAAGMVGVWLFARPLMALFSSDPSVIGVGVEYLRISVFVYWAYVTLYVHVSALQGMKKPLFAIWVGLARQLVLAVPAFVFFADVLGMGLTGIWVGIFAVTWLTAAVTWWYTNRVIERENTAAT